MTLRSSTTDGLNLEGSLIVPRDRVVIIGAGIGGLVSAVMLAARGLDVTILEAEAAPGGKMREIAPAAGAGGPKTAIDAGPTVFTMRWVFDELFGSLGLRLEDHLRLHRSETIARHAWPDGERLDLFADLDRSVAAVAAMAGAAEGERFRRFSHAAAAIYDELEQPFLRAERPSAIGLVRAAGVTGLARLARLGAFSTMWGGISRHFSDPRLRQLFGRYATYCGSSPFLAPATLMLIAHVERSGVWLVEGGMHRVARVLAGLAVSHGAQIRYRAKGAEILAASGRVDGIRLEDGTRVPADIVVCNADAGALAAGRLGEAVRRAAAPVPADRRSFSAITFAGRVATRGFPLLRHTVFFSSDYEREFDELSRLQAVPSEPTIYVCAQDRGDRDQPVAAGPERLLLLVNAPPTGDVRSSESWETERCQTRILERLNRFGLEIEPARGEMVATTPTGFERLFPATGGALYGRATHGWAASFQRACSRTSVAGLYLAGGSTHPGPGVPMAALSGRIAASSILEDLAAACLTRAPSSTSRLRSRRAGMAGGTSMD